MSYAVNALGYTHPPIFDTLSEAKTEMKKYIADDKSRNYMSLTLIHHSPLHKELKIGGKQGYHTYSEYWITKM